MISGNADHEVARLRKFIKLGNEANLRVELLATKTTFDGLGLSAGTAFYGAQVEEGQTDDFGQVILKFCRPG